MPASSSSSSSSRSLGLSVSRPVVFPLSHRAVAHTSLPPPPPPSFSLFPIVSYLLLDKRWCISSLGVKSCQVYSALSFLRTKRARRVSITITLFISIGGEEKRFPDIVYLCIVIFSATSEIFVTKNTNRCIPRISEYVQIRVFRLIILFFRDDIKKRKEPSKRDPRKRSFFFERRMIIR